MTAYSRLQEKEFSRESDHGYEAVKHQRFVGTGYFDALTQVIARGLSSITALEGSTEAAQFAEIEPEARLQHRLVAQSIPLLEDIASIGFAPEILPTNEESLLPSGD